MFLSLILLLFIRSINIDFNFNFIKLKKHYKSIYLYLNKKIKNAALKRSEKIKTLHFIEKICIVNIRKI